MTMQKIWDLIREMTLEEKIGMIHGQGIFHTKGVERLGIPPLWMSDGPMGVRKELQDDNWAPKGTTDDYVSYLPSNTAIACTWNRERAADMGCVLGQEARGRGKDVILAPGINLIRSPLCGRNFEYMSEDPHLISEMAVPLIRGIEEQDTAACVKHFALNNQETRRLDVEAAVENGLDIEMSVTSDFDQYCMADPLAEKVRSGEVPEARLDEKVKNILVLMDRLHMLDGVRKRGSYNTRDHQEAILKCAEEAIVLLKNEGGILPLKPVKRLAVIGENAGKMHSSGGGSAAIKALYELTPLMGLKMELGGAVSVEYAPGYQSDGEKSAEQENWQAESLEERAYKASYKGDGSDAAEKRRRELIREAAALAESCENAVLFIGLNHEFDLEGCDRTDMKLPYGQEELISAVLDANENTVIAVTAGSPVDMEVFADRAKAIVYSSYNGMEGGLAMAEVLLGRVNPSGRLPFTIPKRLEDCPAHSIGEFPGGDTVAYRESIYVGYRYYETERKVVRYCFGHGLSYTEFSYGDLKLERREDGIYGTVTVRNCGSVAGAEVVEIYVGAAGKTVKRPARELKGFVKVRLQPGEERAVDFRLPWKAFSYYNEEKRAFEVPEDEYSACVGRSVGDVRLVQTVEIKENDALGGKCRSITHV